MNTLLYISLPGSAEYDVYIPANGEESVEFTFHAFSEKSAAKSLRLSMVKTAEPNNPVAREDDTESKVYTNQQYSELLEKTISEIKSKDLGKIVISRIQDFPIDEAKPLMMYEKLVKAYPEACVYLFQHENVGLWMGATPETLVKGDGKVLETMSLAGTRVVGEEDSFEEKEELEQSLVTDYIENKLKHITGVEEVLVGEKKMLRAGNLYHFLNKIEARYNSRLNLEGLLKELHPTPAVGGFPKEEALSFIKKNEWHDRHYYSGYFGIKNKESFHYFVNLRCMQLFTNKMTLYAGGGITAASEPIKEWEETNAKMKTLLNVLAPEITE